MIGKNRPAPTSRGPSPFSRGSQNRASDRDHPKVQLRLALRHLRCAARRCRFGPITNYGLSGIPSVRTIQLTSYIRFCAPADWSELSPGKWILCLRTPDGGTFSAQVHEFRKPIKPGTGLGPKSEQMLSMQVAQLGAPVRTLAPGRAFATHPIPIGEPGRQQECRAWHIVNQVAAWHHETLLFIYEPPPGGELNPAVVSLLDDELPRCEFARCLDFAAQGTDADTSNPAKSKRWWRFW